MKLANIMVLILLFSFMGLIDTQARADVPLFTYEGYLTDASGTPKTGAYQAKIKIYSSVAATCELYDSGQISINASSPDGFFTLRFGENTSAYGELFTTKSKTCLNSVQTTTDVAQALSIELWNGTAYEAMSDLVLFGNVAYAMRSDYLGDKPASSYVVKPSSCSGDQILKFDGTGFICSEVSSLSTTSSTIVGSIWYDTTNNNIKFYDGTSTQTLGIQGLTTGDSITSGTIGGATSFNTTGNIATTGTLTGGTISTTGAITSNSVSTNSASVRNVILNGATSGSVTLSVPSAITNYTLNFPAAIGSVDQVLKTDATGNLSWYSIPTNGSSSIDTVGTVTTGTWNGTTIGIGYGGTGAASKADAFDALSPSTIKGDLLVRDATTNTRLPAGSDNQVLISDGAQAAGLRWTNLPSDLPATAGTVSSPAYSFQSDTSTGIFNPGAGKVGFASGGIEKMRLTSTGLGIGTTMPGSALDVRGEIRMSGSTSGYVGFQPAAAAGSTVWTLPTTDGSANQVLTTSGTGILTWTTPATSGITSLNGLNSGSQNFAIPGTSGTAPNWISGSGDHTLHIPMAATTGVTAGLISKTEYDTFNAKLGTGTVFVGDVGGSYNSLTLGAGVVTNSNLANMATMTIKGNVTGGSAAPIDIPIANLQGTTGSTFAAGNDSRVTGAVQSNGGTMTGMLTLAAGTTSLAPLRVPAGTLVTTAASGNIENDGTNLYFTNSTPARQTLASYAGAPADGKLLIGSSTGFSLANLTQGTGITITNFAGGITISATGSGGTVTSVTSANGDIGVATTNSTPVLTLNSGTTGGAGDANKIAKLDASGLLTTAMVPTLDAGKIGSGVLPIVRGGTNSSTALNNNRLMVSSGGAIVEAAAVTGSKALISDANGIPVHSAVTSTELGYLSGVTSSIQTQINDKASAAGWSNYSVIGANGSGTLTSIAGATGNTMLQWTVTGPVWSTASYPNSTTANQILFSSANNVVGGLSTANDAVLRTDASGVPSWSALSNDNFQQYALLAGRAGGQILVGGTAASNSLTLESTSNATKGPIVLNPTGGNVGIGTSTPWTNLAVNGTDENTGLTVKNADSTAAQRYPNISVVNYGGSYGGNPSVILQNSRGNGAVPQSINSSDVLGDIKFIGRGTGGSYLGAKIEAVASSNWNSAPTPASLNFFTAPTAGGAAVQSMTITGDGNVGIGVSSPTVKLQVNGDIYPGADNISALGNSSYRFTDVFATNGVTTTSDAREKFAIEKTDLGLDFILKLRPVSYRWSSGIDQNTHYGLIAQETEEVVRQSLRTPASQQEIPIVDKDKKTGRYGLRYSELISPLIKALQDIYEEFSGKISDNAQAIDELKAQNKELREKNLELQTQLQKNQQENDAIKAYLCRQDPNAGLCR